MLKRALPVLVASLVLGSAPAVAATTLDPAAVAARTQVTLRYNNGVVVSTANSHESRPALSHGEIGKATGVGARYVGWVMRVHGADLPWWRVLRADGSPHDPERVWPRWEDEGIGRLASGKADMRAHGLDARDLRALFHGKED